MVRGPSSRRLKAPWRLQLASLLEPDRSSTEPRHHRPRAVSRSSAELGEEGSSPSAEKVTAELTHLVLDPRRRVAERDVRSEIERYRRGDEEVLMINCERRIAWSKWLKAESGTIVSQKVLTAAPVEIGPRHGQAQRREHHRQGQRLVVEHPLQEPAVLGNQRVKLSLAFARHQRHFPGAPVTQHLGAHHRHQRQRTKSMRRPAEARFSATKARVSYENSIKRFASTAIFRILLG